MLRAVAGAIPGGSSGQLQYNNSGAFGGAAEITRGAPGSGAAITIASQNAGDIAEVVKGFSGQSGRLTSWQNSVGGELAFVTAAGNSFFPLMSCNTLSLVLHPTQVSNASNITINSGADGAGNIGHRIPISTSDGTFWVPASATAF